MRFGKSCFVLFATGIHKGAAYRLSSSYRLGALPSCFQASVANRPIVRHFRSTGGLWQQNDSDKKKSQQNEPQKFNWSGIVRSAAYALGIAAIAGYLSSSSRVEDVRLVPWNTFVYEMLAKGEVAELIVTDSDTIIIRLHEGAVIKGQPAPFLLYHMRVPDLKSFEDNVRQAEQELGISAESGVSIVYRRNSNWPFLVLLAVFSYLLFRTFFKSAKGGAVKLNFPDIYGNLRKARYRVVSPFGVSSVPKVKFSDVLGLTEAKMEVKEFVDYLKRPGEYTRLGAKLPRGALLLGPPGCGKTLLAKAVASEASVPFLAINGTEFIEIIGGLGAARVRDLFKEAKRRIPCIIYIDEIDAIGRRRGGPSDSAGVNQNSEEEQTLNQLLVEMDGIGSNTGVIILASTNRPDVLDKALLRRGRFDRHILIDLPTNSERAAMFHYYLGKVKTTEPITCFDYLANRTPGYSGADIMNVCNEAAIRAATLGKEAVDLTDVEYALERTMSGVERKTSSVTQKERERIAYHECGHALVGWMLEHTDALVKVSIIPRTKNITGMGFTQHSKSEKRLLSKEELLERMSMALGGCAAENLIYGSTSSGAENDLKKVTRIAYDIIRRYGMADRLEPIAFAGTSDNDSTDFLPKPYSKQLQSLIDEEARSLVRNAYDTAERILREKRDSLNLLAVTLLTRESLTYGEIAELIGPPVFGPKDLSQKELQFPEGMGSKQA